MFNYDVIDTDAFLGMPLSTQALYFHLNMRADDDGFISNPKRVQKYIGASEDDLKLLIAKRFVITFEDGVLVIKHWRMHNTIQRDRYHPTNYQEDLAMLGLKRNKAYTLNGDKMETKCLQDVPANGNKMETSCLQNVSTDLGLDLDIDKENRSINISGQSSENQTSEPEADVEAIPLNDGTEWRPTQALFAEYVRLYPNVDVKQQFNEMRGWCLSNPAKKKTKRGVKRFVNSWLSREQDQGGRQQKRNENRDISAGEYYKKHMHIYKLEENQPVSSENKKPLDWR